MALSASCDGCEGLVDDAEEVESAGFNIEGRCAGVIRGVKGGRHGKNLSYRIGSAILIFHLQLLQLLNTIKILHAKCGPIYANFALRLAVLSLKSYIERKTICTFFHV